MNKAIRNKLFRRWLIFQLVFFTILMCVAFLIYIITTGEIKRQINDLYKEKLHTVSSEIDYMIKTAHAEGIKYSIDPMLKTLRQSYLEVDSGVIKTRMIDSIKQTNSANESIREIIIYFRDIDLFLTSAGIMDGEIFELVYCGDHTKCSIADNIANEDVYNEITKVTISRELGESISTGAIYIKGTESDVIVILNDLEAQQILSNSVWGIGDRMDVELVSGTNLFTVDLKDAESENQTGKVNIITSISEDSGLVYKWTIPSKFFFRKYFDLLRTAFIILITTGALGLVISYLITKVNYKPIGGLVQASMEIVEEEFEGDELEKINKAIAESAKKNKILTNHEGYIRENTWRMILSGMLKFDELTEYMRSIIGSVNIPVFTVVIDSYMGTPEFKKNELWNYAACDIVMGGRKVAVFKTSDYSRGEIIEGIRKCLGPGMLLGAGNEVESIDRLSESFNEALSRMRFGFYRTKEPVIVSEDEEKTQRNVANDLNEYELIRDIQSGNTAAAFKALHMIIENIESKQGFMNHVNYYYLANVLLNAASTFGNDWNPTSEFVERFRSAIEGKIPGEINRVIYEYMEKICNKYNEAAKNPNEILSKRLMDIIDDNITDEKLSPEFVGSCTALNQSYIRSFFRQYNGIGFWDYVNSKRIKTAQAMLLNSNAPVGKIARACGFQSISTFMRAFKKETGMTPVQYRKIGQG